MFRRVSAPDVLNSVKEPEHIVKQRNMYNERLDVLKRSKDLLTRDADLNSGSSIDL